MSRGDPQYGQVVRFWYLWASQAFDGEIRAEKLRPCAIVVALKPKEGETQKVMLCGITHTEPRAPSEGIFIPAEVKQSLGLDDGPTWVITSEVNQVDWSDARFATAPSGEWTYGLFPEELMEEIRDRIRGRINARKMDVVNRSEIDKRAGR